METFDTTKKREKDFCEFIKNLEKDGLLCENIVSRIKPIGSSRPRLYGVPKTHKDGMPLRPVLSTTGSFQQPLARFLKEVLQSVYNKYSAHCIPDSFSFATMIKESEHNHMPYLCSFDEIILICVFG